MKLNFSVGFHMFHKDERLNFQLNRFYISGVLSYDELAEIGSQITSFDSWIKLFLKLAQEAEEKGNMEKSAICYRAAQFYTLGNQKDTEGKLIKEALYEKCFEAYAKAYSKEDWLKYDRIPFKSGYLPVYIMRQSGESKGVIMMHGVYDSFMHEFVRYAVYIYNAGYNVYLFEGPGQVEVLCRCNIKMTPQWEHCVSAVLDHYGLDEVTLIGISLGGYLATRVSAYEQRVKKLIMLDLIYDFYGSLRARMGKVEGAFLEYLTECPRNFMWRFVEKRMNHMYFMNWLFEKGYYIYERINTPCEYFNCIKQYNIKSISGMTRRETLVLAGASDLYTVYLREQVDALVIQNQ